MSSRELLAAGVATAIIILRCQKKRKRRQFWMSQFLESCSLSAGILSEIQRFGGKTATTTKKKRKLDVEPGKSVTGTSADITNSESDNINDTKEILNENTNSETEIPEVTSYYEAPTKECVQSGSYVLVRFVSGKAEKMATRNLEEAESSTKTFQSKELNERPLKKARYVWQIKGKHHLKNTENIQSESFMAPINVNEPYHIGAHHSSTCNKKDCCEDQCFNVLKNNSNELCHAKMHRCSLNSCKSDCQDVMDVESGDPIEPVCPEVEQKENLMTSSLESLDVCTSPLQDASITSSQVNAGQTVDSPIFCPHSPDWQIRKWQSRQMARSYIDNTLNHAMDDREMGFVPLDVDSEMMEESFTDDCIEGKAVLMAIHNYGLQRSLFFDMGTVCRCASSDSSSDSVSSCSKFYNGKKTDDTCIKDVDSHSKKVDLHLSEVVPSIIEGVSALDPNISEEQTVTTLNRTVSVQLIKPLPQRLLDIAFTTLRFPPPFTYSSREEASLNEFLNILMELTGVVGISSTEVQSSLAFHVTTLVVYAGALCYLHLTSYWCVLGLSASFQNPQNINNMTINY
uniref:Uncharacterized protein n=1 Tax=Timema cristinae TaxID=61476 RepID=A0A7R9CF94_TIMCR|nr:unnamed protein product [Timema cristinae]